MSNQSCATIKNKSWPYQQYYVGERDSEGRRNGGGENHWTGAKSLEWYCGRLLRDTMHGIGEYYWRYIDPEGAFVSYEGHFYCNQMHGYGTKSYPDGRVFEGLFHSNLRWGPGVECHISVRENVGLWLGNQLIRLCWRPSTTSLFLDFMGTSTGRACVTAARNLMTSYSEPINKNTVIELLVEYGLDQQAAEEKWMKLQAKHCSDISSPVFPLQLFEDNYYGSGNKNILQESKKISESTVDFQEKQYFAWNNNEIIKHMMKHSFTHDTQTARTRLNISKILSGPRHNFKPPVKHELDCRTLLMASYLGETNVVVQLVNEEGIHADVTDMQGNSVLVYAVCGEQREIIHFLVEAGAGIDNYNDSCCTALSVALIRFNCARKNISANDMTQALIPETNLPRDQTVSEWNLVRDVSSLKNALTKNSSKIMKSLTSLKEIPPPKKSPDISVKLEQDSISENENINKSIELFTEINNKYASKTAELYSAISTGNPIPYIFEVHNITNEFEGIVEEPKKTSVKNPKRVISTALKESVKPTNGNMRHSNDYTKSKNFFNRLILVSMIIYTIYTLPTTDNVHYIYITYN
ncbi:unnamed protein product [Parnassius mnemosyne]|uniref:Ankyrin repeat and MYND domain-containing protein 1 n=1 Tax=Parnassius mnemosyne TaxID=213953 RepID=A0AAV1M3U6_9NEOP